MGSIKRAKKYYTIYIIKNTILLIMAPCSVEEKVHWGNPHLQV